MEVTIRYASAERVGNDLVLYGPDHGVTTRLAFGSDSQLKEWLLKATVAVLGKERAELVTGERFPA